MLSRLFEFFGLNAGHTFFVVSALNLVQRVADSVLDLFFGYTTRHGWTSSAQREAGNYEKSAQTVRILYRGAFSPLFDHQPENFLLLHEGRGHPGQVLGMDRATLMGCSETHAWFAVSEDGVDLTDSRKYPFLMIAQYQYAKKLVIMPWWAAHRLADELGDPDEDRQIVGMMHTGRCGSTLAGNLFRELPDTHVLNEPWALWHPQDRFFRGAISADQHREMVRSCLRLQYKPVVKDGVRHKRTVVKWGCANVAQAEIMTEVFPAQKLVMVVRNPRSTIRSYYETWQSPLISMYCTHQRRGHVYCNLSFDHDDPSLQSFRVRMHARDDTTVFEDVVCNAAGGWHYFLRHRELFAYNVVYSDLLSSPESEAASMLASVGVPASEAALAVRALESHSQNKIFEGGRDKAELKYVEATESDWARAEHILREDMGLPFGVDVKEAEFAEIMRWPKRK